MLCLFKSPRHPPSTQIVPLKIYLILIQFILAGVLVYLVEILYEFGVGFVWWMVYVIWIGEVVE